MSNTEETDLTEAEMVPDDGQLMIGVVLKDAREQRKMTVEDVCTHLRISPHQVKALESDNFSALPEAMITRGFIRNYARLLQIDAEPLLKAYRTFVPSAAPRALTLKSENILITGKDKQPWLKYIIASLVIALLLGIWQYYMDYSSKPPAQQAIVPAETTDKVKEANANEGTAVETMPAPATQVSELPVAALPAAERVSNDEAQTTPAPDSAAPDAISPAPQTTTAANSSPQSSSDVKPAEKTTAKIKFSFSEVSWVNVTDRNKKMIFDRIMPAGSEEIVQGEPPLEVVIGNAPGSKLMFNDKLVDLAPYTRSNVARVTLE